MILSFKFLYEEFLIFIRDVTKYVKLLLLYVHFDLSTILLYAIDVPSMRELASEEKIFVGTDCTLIIGFGSHAVRISEAKIRIKIDKNLINCS